MSQRRLLAVWLVLAMTMVLNGIFRELALAPVLGARAAGVASAALGIAIILGITWLFLRRPAFPLPIQERAAIAFQWVAMTVAFELVFGHWVDGKPWSELLANYDLAAGRLWPLVLAALALAPFLWGRDVPASSEA